MAGVEPLSLDSGHLASARCVSINSVPYGPRRNGGGLQNGRLRRLISDVIDRFLRFNCRDVPTASWPFISQQ
jgi:hypothetical protein